jgi:hypothetical protein
VNTTTILDLIAAREAAASAARDQLREQQAKLAAEVAAIDCELADGPAPLVSHARLPHRPPIGAERRPEHTLRTPTQPALRQGHPVPRG